MGAFYRKWIRMFWALLIGNALIALIQLGFSYGHYLKHEWWMLAVSAFFFGFNGYFSFKQWQHIKRVRREEQEYMWRTLSTPSEAIR